jgi:autotransporter passenger strand-loop-strand repeat protein
MNIKELELDGLVLADSNTDYSGAQTVFLDFDGADDVSYNNDALGIHIDHIDVADSGLNEEQQFQILTDLNTKFADTGISFTTSIPEHNEYSTIYIGETQAFDSYGALLGIAETVDCGNINKSDNAFVLSNQIDSVNGIGIEITHETAHLLGFQHTEESVGSAAESYALDSSAYQVTLQITNNFKDKSKYFSANYSDDYVWLYSIGTGNSLSYFSISQNTTVTVTDKTAFQLSDVSNGTLTITEGPGSSKLFLALGASNTISPFSSTDGPQTSDNDIPYSLIEWTVKGNVNDNCDVSYLDSFSFPTTLTVTNGLGVQTDQATFKAGTTAEMIINSLKAVMSDQPVGPSGDNYPRQGENGWGPLVPTVLDNADAYRWIGSSKSWQSGQAAGSDQSLYVYAPLFNDYLGYLYNNEKNLFGDSLPKGWYLDYSGNGGYSFYLSVTGSDGNYGLSIHDVRLNTEGSSGVPTSPWLATPDKWTSLNGTITIAANNETVSYYTNPSDPSQGQYDITGNWTDLTIYSGASALNDDFINGPIVTTTGDLVAHQESSKLVASILASVSASIATGLLGNKYYMQYIEENNPGGELNFPPVSTPVSTMYWFSQLPRADYNTYLFDGGWDSGQEFYDPFWKTLAEYTDMQGYLSTFSDRWSKMSPGFDLASDYKIAWDIGIPASTTEPDGLFSNVTGNRVSLNWSDFPSTVTEYVVETADNSSMTNPTSKTVTQSELDLLGLANGTFYWRVKAVENGGQSSGWSTVQSFTVNYSGFTSVVSSGLNVSSEIVTNGPQTVLSGGITSSSTVVNSNSTQIINSGGVASNSVIASGASQVVNNGGSIFGTTVNNSGAVILSSGAVANSATITNGGAIHVYSGAIVSNTDVLYGVLGVGDGGSASSTTINTRGNMTVWDGGVVTSNTINNQGVIVLSSGAVASSSTINSGGGMNVYSGAVISNTTVNQSGYLGIGDGAVASGTTIGYAGALTVWGGGVINNNTIQNYGAIILSSGAVASQTIIYSNGGLNVYSGAVASNTTVNQGGYLGVGLGATTYDTTIGYAGALTVWGGGVVQSNTIGQWGAIILSSGAVANSTTINSQGGLHIYSGASAYTTQINSGADLGIGLGGLLYGSTESYGASVVFYEGARIGGWNTFAGSVTLAGGLDASGSYVSFDISNRSTGDSYILNNLGNLYNATLSVKTDSSQAIGRYSLSFGASGFTGSLTVYEGDSDKGTVSLSQSLTVDNRRYDLQLLNNELYLDISSSVSQAVSSMQASESTTFAALSAYPDSISSDTVGYQPLWTQNEYGDMAFSDTSSLYTSQGCISSGMLAG